MKKAKLIPIEGGYQKDLEVDILRETEKTWFVAQPGGYPERRFRKSDGREVGPFSQDFPKRVCQPY